MPSCDLEAALSNRRWRRRELPFPHVTATEVFRADVYAALAGSFNELLARGLSEHPCDEQFSRNMGNYDAYAMNLHPRFRGPLELFVSRPWHDLLAGLFGIKATGDMVGGLHHHLPGSRSGFIHNDLNPGWFAGEPLAGTVIRSDPAVCNYHNGATTTPGVRAREEVRAAALIFYLSNGDWRQGDGGETALYARGKSQGDQPVLKVPPIDNSLVAFECTPRSWHTFVANVRCPRNSIVVWVHRSMREAVERWGVHSIVNW